MARDIGPRRPVGRPTLYREAYCNEVIEAGGEGLSLTAFAGIIGVDRRTIGEWMDAHPEFFLACKKAQAKRTLFLERGMLANDATGPMVTARRFALANAAPDEWREKQEVDQRIQLAVVDVPPEAGGFADWIAGLKGGDSNK